MSDHIKLENGVLLSIVVPVYNRQSGLDRLLMSLYSSLGYDAYKNFIELILIDDASNEAVASPFACVEEPVLIRNNKNLGAVRSRKKGCELSVGKFIHFHDSDDGFPKDWLSSVMDYILNDSDFDVMLTGRNNISNNSSSYKYQQYFHKYYGDLRRLKKRLVYRNCMGPLGGIIFSRKILTGQTFKPMASSQDWYMYIDVLDRAKKLVSRPDITYDFYIDGDDRISHNSRKKVLGFLQLSRTTAKRSIFGRNIRLFYLYTCRQHIHKKGGLIARFYKKHYLLIIFYYTIITIYWRLT